MQLLEGKVAIITGAGRGIGRACAELFAAHGARVVLSDIDPEPTHEAAETIKGNDGDALAVPGDVTEADFAPRLIKETLDRFGRIDSIVNNAGYTWDGTVHKMTDEQWQAMLDVHLTAPFRIIRAASGYLRETAKREKEEQGRAQPRKIGQRQLNHWDARQCGAGELRGGQSRDHRRDQNAGEGVGTVQHSGQRRRLRLHRDQTDASEGIGRATHARVGGDRSRHPAGEPRDRLQDDSVGARRHSRRGGRARPLLLLAAQQLRVRASVGSNGRTVR